MTIRCCLLALLFAPAAAAAPVTLEQVVSREHPDFKTATARLTVGRDGKVYLASSGNNSYVLRVGRDGKDRFGGLVVYATHNATANADGVVATANAHFAHKVTLYDRNLRQAASLDDFLNNDQVGWSAPSHVEAGASGDFYGLDHSRDRVVRLNPQGKQLKAYQVPRRPEGDRGRAWDFRVCEKTESFYVFGGGPLYRVGFDGRVKWVLDAKVDPGVRWGDNGNAGGVDVDGDGNLYLIGPHSDEVRLVSPDGKQTGKVTLAGGPKIPRSGSDGSVRELRVFADDLVVRRRDATELFVVYDRRTGKHRHTVRARAERLRVKLADRRWTAGEEAALTVELEPGTVKAPAWRVWVRSPDEADDRELPWADGKVAVPADLGGVYLIRVSPEARPWRGGTLPEYLLRTWVDVRQPGAKGTLSIWTRGRTRFARGEAVPVSALLRAKGEKKPEKVTLKLVESPGGKVVAREEVTLEPNVESTKAGIACTAELRPGRYLLTADAPGRTVAAQPLVIGPGGRSDPDFFFMQYGDYGPTYPEADAWDLPAVSHAHVARSERLGLNLFVDRLGFPLMSGATQPARRPPEMEGMPEALAADPDGVAPEKVRPPILLGPVMAGYSAAGMRQMAILMGNDAGLPLGTGFDNRKPEQLTAAIDRVTGALARYPAFRGWSWSSNWWVFDQRGANAARDAKEKAEYEAAHKEALKSGKWDAVLDRVASRRLGYAPEAQAAFNAALKKHGKFVTASAAPYRNVEAYPPLTFANVDEVDLQAQWEQIAVPYAAAHGVDFYKRPGKRAWVHPEAWNDSGTGDQVVPTLFLGLMRGADGVGGSGPVPPWAPRPRDPRSGHAGIASVWRAVGEVVKAYGPWLRTLNNNDRVAIVVSGRMLKIDDWPNVYGTHFARLMDAYSACLHAHHPASYVFVDDLKPGALERFKAVLVVDQRVEFEPELLKALRAAKKAGVKVFHDGTSRAELVKDFTPLGASFTRFEKDPSPASDDAAYERFPRYALTSVPALRKALDPAAERVARTDEAEFLISERVAGKGRFVFVVNHTTPPHSPGQMWRQNLLVASRAPVAAKIDLGKGAKHVYDVFAMKKVEPKEGAVTADCRDLQARLFAVLPAAIGSVELKLPAKARAGGSFRCGFAVLDADGKPIDAPLPVRLRVRARGGEPIEERSLACASRGGEATFVVPRNLPAGEVEVELTDLLGGTSLSARVAVEAVGRPGGFAAGKDEPAAPTERNAADARPGGAAPERSEARFGPRLRGVAVSGDGKTAYLSAFAWGDNLFAVDLEKGEPRWRRRVGHSFAYAPAALKDGVAVQGFDFLTSEGYHLYLIGRDGKASRRVALFGAPGRLPHRFVPSILNDRLNQFAVTADGTRVDVAGNLGRAHWQKGSDLTGMINYAKLGIEPALLHRSDDDCLLVVHGVEVVAHSNDGHVHWRQTLAPSGQTKRIRSTPNGRTIALLTDAEGGRLFVLDRPSRGKVRHAIPCAGDDFALSDDGDALAVVEGRMLRFYARGALRWAMPADDVLHHPRFSADGKRVACASEAGTLYVVGSDGKLLLERDLGAIVVPAFLPGGDLLTAGWAGRVARLGPDYRERWSLLLRSEGDVRDRLLVRDRTPTERFTGWGNALEKPLPLGENLLSPKTCRIEFESSLHHAPLVGKTEALVDGKADPPAQPWLEWPTVGWLAEGKSFTALRFDTFRRRLRVEAVTLAEDPRHPESWLRDCRLEYWDAAKGEWVLAMRLLSDAATHSHRLEKPAEASRWRLVPSHLSGNLRLGEVALYGKDLGPSHPDVVARRPVAVLFDEGDELKEAGMVHPVWGLSFAFGGAHSGGRYLRLEADRSVAPVYKPPFGHVLPDWDFEVVQKPGPGQYRYVRFAAKGLSDRTAGLVLRLDGESYGRAVSCYAGTYRKEDDAVGKQVAEKVPGEWAVYTVDLWEVLQKPVRVRGLRLSATGGPAAFDRVLLGRSMEDLKRAK